MAVFTIKNSRKGITAPPGLAAIEEGIEEMFSMKYIDGHGVEWLEGGFLRTCSNRDDEGLLYISGDRPDGSTHTFFQDRERLAEYRTVPRLYVMNEQGVTVADYAMVAPMDAPLAAGAPK
ncbi:MAG: hypothetical protein ACRCVX_12535 [Shewanella sp.]